MQQRLKHYEIIQIINVGIFMTFAFLVPRDWRGAREHVGRCLDSRILYFAVAHCG